MKEENLDAIVRSLQVSFVSRKCLYIKEFILRLNSYGLDQMIIQNPLVCQPLFVAGDLKEDVTPDADYLFSLLNLIIHGKAHQDDALKRASWTCVCVWTSFKIFSILKLN